MNLRIEAPVKTVSELNQRDHWATRNKRRQQQRRDVYFAWRVAMIGSRKPKLPCTVKLTRVGPKTLDDDNLRGALKFVRDQIAELLGADDADPRLKFEYDQRVGEYGVVIEVSAQ